MHSVQTIEDYISFMRANIPNAIEIFTSGNCGGFARMLDKMFHGGEIHHNICHAVWYFNEEYYDITGRITKEQLESPMYSGMRPIMDMGLDKAIEILKPRYK